MAEVGFENGFIRLEETPPVYYPGQTLSGSVVFHLREPLYFNALYIQFRGETNVLWTYVTIDKVNGIRHQREVRYVGHEEYFNNTEILAGGNGTAELTQTQYTFPFKFQIPFDCPSSFKGQKGSVSYTITATMVYADMRQEVLKYEFTVVAPLDLNTGNPAIKEPIDLELEELNPCTWFCDSEAITVRVRLPVTGYCPGQLIPVAVEVQNNSSVEITKMIFEITTGEIYRSQQPPSEFVVPGRTLTSVNKGAVMSKCTRNFTCEVPVPDMVVPYLEHCSIIDIGYFFKVTVGLSGCNEDLQDESEICLGLVPLKETVSTGYIHPMADRLPSGPVPVRDKRTELIALPGPTPPFQGSHHSLNRSQNNLNHSASNINYPQPYPASNAPYPSENKYPNSSEIGFRTPQRLSASDMPYPNAAVPIANPPYPAASLMPGASPPPYPGIPSQGASPQPYPTNPAPLNISGQSTYAPSAPPAD